MNRTTIEWTDYTWNPITGCTNHCTWCYARRLANGRLRKTYLTNTNIAPGCNPHDPFSPRFWRDRLTAPGAAKTPLKIFTCSMGELFDLHVPTHWINAVLAAAALSPQHTFQFLTQQPFRAARFRFPPNAWVGVTIQDHSPPNLAKITLFARVTANVRFFSYEPLIGPIYSIPHSVQWIIIGAMTGPNAVKPKPHWIKRLIYLADKQDIPVFLKDNLDWPEPRQEWPRRA